MTIKKKNLITNKDGISMVECAKCECIVHEVYAGPMGFMFKCTNCGVCFKVNINIGVEFNVQ